MTVVFWYQEERAGEFAAYAAVRVTEALTRGDKYKPSEEINRLHDIREDENFGPSAYFIVSEAVIRGIPYIRLNRSGIRKVPEAHTAYHDLSHCLLCR